MNSITGTKLNALIAGAIALVNSIIPALTVLNVVSLTSDQMAAIYLVVSNTATFVGLLFANNPSTNTEQ